MQNILFISGSLRADSFNTKLLRAFEKALPEGVKSAWGDISSLPLFNEELEANFPQSAILLKEQIVSADAVIISTPEYNRGMSGALKNAIDWISRPYGNNSWKEKRVLVTSVSPGALGGALALYQVKQSLLHLGAEVLGNPEFIVGSAQEKFSEEGILTDQKTQTFIGVALDILLKR